MMRYWTPGKPIPGAEKVKTFLGRPTGKPLK
jgi:hypothetical protein